MAIESLSIGPKDKHVYYVRLIPSFVLRKHWQIFLRYENRKAPRLFVKSTHCLLQASAHHAQRNLVQAVNCELDPKPVSRNCLGGGQGDRAHSPNPGGVTRAHHRFCSKQQLVKMPPGTFLDWGGSNTKGHTGLEPLKLPSSQLHISRKHNEGWRWLLQRPKLSFQNSHQAAHNNPCSL